MSSQRHWLKPCKPGTPTGRHALLYVEEKQHKGRVIPGQRNAWQIDLNGINTTAGLVDSWTNTDQLDNVLSQVCLQKGETTIWVSRGWTDLVLSGLVELIDAGVITWRYVSLSGRSCLLKGLWRGRKITITSLTNWTGNRWDSWGDTSTDEAVQQVLTAVPTTEFVGGATRDDEEYNQVCTLISIFQTCRMLAVKRIPPTSGAAGLLLWRSWLGPRVAVSDTKPKKGRASNVEKSTVYVAPIPSRPIKAANAERHCCYAMTTRQLRVGKVDSDIYCMDLRSAYLVGLTMTPIPLVYDATLHRPKREELAERMQKHTGCALVRIQSSDWYYPCRLSNRVVPCKGRFWTWLAGAELIHALCSDHIAECWTAYLWHASIMPDRERLELDCLRLSCQKLNYSAVALAWRSVYSSLVGRFAGWQRVWKDSPAHPGFGRWASWVQADHDTGVVVPHRSIGGKVQYLAEKVDKQDSVPLLFGCVTSMVRWVINSIATTVGYDHIHAIAADSIWMDQAGWQSVQKAVSACGLPPDNIKCKAIYDRAWMTGKNILVTERNGVKQLHMPGVSNGASLDSEGRVVIEHTDDWDSDGEPRASKGIRRRKHRYSTEQILRDYAFPARQLLPGEEVNIPLLSDTLLRELRGERTIEDA